MKINILYSTVFRKNARRLRKRYSSLFADIEALEKELMIHPEMGVSLGEGVRKIRIAISSKGKGKRSGARVITYQDIIFSVSERIIVMVTIYDKSEKDSITMKDIKSILRKL